MASTYVNDLRLNEMATGDQSGSWGTVTNTNLELIGEAFSYGTEAITTNANTHTTTIADGATDAGRSMFLKYTGALDSACTITIGPNTVSKMWFIENATTGSQNIIISQGSGANITIAAGQTKAVYSDGAGAGAAFVDAFAALSVVGLLVNEIRFEGDTGSDALIQKNASSGRDELQIYAAGDANTSGSRGAGMQLYGNYDNEHDGNIAFITGPDDEGAGRMFVSGWDTNTHVTIGNGPTGETIWEFVDNHKDKALLNLINPTGGPALFIMEANGTTEGDITVNDGESMQFGHWNYGTSTYTHRMSMTTSGLDVVGGITAGGSVGIGTDSPAHALDVQDTGDTVLRVKAKSSGAGNDDDAILRLDSAEAGEGLIDFYHQGVSEASVEWVSSSKELNIRTAAGTNGVIDFQPNNTLAMRIDASGNIAVTGTVDGRDIAADGTTLDAILPVATTAQWRDNTADKLLSTDQVWGAMAEVTITYGAPTAWDMDTGIDFVLTLTGSPTVSNPTNAQIGKRGRIRVVQDGTGSRVITWSSSYVFADGAAPDLTLTAAAEDYLYYDVRSATAILITPVLAVAP